MAKSKKKIKKYIPVVILKGSKNTFMEFGIIKNPSFNNVIYWKIKSTHKEYEEKWEMRLDETFYLIESLLIVLRRKLIGSYKILSELIDKERKNGKK